MLAALLFGALLLFGLISGVAFMPARRGSSTATKADNPAEYWRIILFETIFAAGCVALAFYRVVPIEDFSGRWKTWTSDSPAARNSAPLWGYFAGFIVIAGILALAWYFLLYIPRNDPP